MGQEICKLDRKEEKIRRNWLLITIFYFLIFPLGFFILSETLLLDKDEIYKAINEGLPIFIIFALIFLWTIWHCAYKKHSTMLLTYCSVSIPYQLCSFVLTICVSGYSSKYSSEYIFWLFSSYFVMYVLWFVSSIRLRKINKKIQAWNIQNEMKHSPEYLQSLENLKAASNIEDLNNLFYETIQSWPRFEKFTSTEYKLVKSKIVG